MDHNEIDLSIVNPNVIEESGEKNDKENDKIYISTPETIVSLKYSESEPEPESESESETDQNVDIEIEPYPYEDVMEYEERLKQIIKRRLVTGYYKKST